MFLPPRIPLNIAEKDLPGVILGLGTSPIRLKAEILRKPLGPSLVGVQFPFPPAMIRRKRGLGRSRTLCKTFLSLGLPPLLKGLQQRKFTLLNTAERHTVSCITVPSPRTVDPSGGLTIGMLLRKECIPLPVLQQWSAACRRSRQWDNVFIPPETDTPPLPKTISRPLSLLTPPTFLQITLLAKVLLLTRVIIRFGLFCSPPV